jgi:hypothetical protein
MNKRKRISKLASLHTLFETGGGRRLGLKELEKLIERLETELLHDDTTSFRGHECIDLIEDYHAGDFTFAVFIRKVRERGGGSIAELKEFAERFRFKKVA